MSQSTSKPIAQDAPANPESQNALEGPDAKAKAPTGRELSDAELDGVAGGAGEDNRSRG